MSSCYARATRAESKGAAQTHGASHLRYLLTQKNLGYEAGHEMEAALQVTQASEHTLDPRG